MAEREERRGGAVDVVALPAAAAARRLVVVEDRHLADAPRHRDGQASARDRQSPNSTSAMASPPSSPGSHASSSGGDVLGDPRQRERPAVDQHDDRRRAGRDDRLDELLLHARQAEVAASRTRRWCSRRSARTCRRRTTIATSALARGRDRRRRSRSRRVDATSQPARVRRPSVAATPRRGCRRAASPSAGSARRGRRAAGRATRRRRSRCSSIAPNTISRCAG